MEVGAIAILDRTARDLSEEGTFKQVRVQTMQRSGKKAFQEEGAVRTLRQACAEFQKQQGMWLAWCEQRGQMRPGLDHPGQSEDSGFPSLCDGKPVQGCEQGRNIIRMTLLLMETSQETIARQHVMVSWTMIVSG